MLCMMNVMTIFAGTGSSPRVVDDAGILGASEADRLISKVNSISDEYKMDVVIVTVYSLDGKSSTAYADDYFDYNGYGQGDDRSGILLLISMEDRDWAISTRGEAIKVFNDDNLRALEDAMLPHLRNDDFNGGVFAFANECESVLKDFAHKEKMRAITRFPKALLIGLIFGFLIATGLKSQLKSVRSKAEASDYVRNGSFNLTTQRDLFLYSDVKSRPKPKESSGGGTHISSSGASHGGSSGKF